MLRRLKQLRLPKGKATTSSTATALKVFSIPELLEEILLYLPLKHLFATQRVCKNFHTTITHSDRLKRKLFLIYHNPTLTHTRPKAEDLINPMLRYHFGRGDYDVSYFLFQWYDFQSKKWNFLQTANASPHELSRVRDQKLKNAWGWKENYIPYESIRKLPSERDESWKKTKLTAVPCIVDATVGVTTEKRGYSREVRFLEGTGTLGDFEKCVREFVSLTDEQHAQQYDRRVVRLIWRGPGDLEPVYNDSGVRS